MANKEVNIKIEGRVQGVGFRYWAAKIAEGIGGISGWVANMDDGSVELALRGEEENLNQMIAACYNGPMWARVDRVSFLPRKSSGFLPDIEDGRFKKF